MPQKYDSLSNAGKKLARIPRFGRLLGQMTTRQLERINTRAATYFELFSYVGPTNDKDKTGLIDSGLNTKGAELLGWTGKDTDDPGPNNPKPNRNNHTTRVWQSQLAMRILGAVAFEMYCHNQKLGRPPTQPIDQDLVTFKQYVCQRCADSGAYVDQLRRPINAVNLFENDLPRVEQMNSHGLEYAVLSSTGEETRHVMGDARRPLLFFADVSTQAFFAAYWALNWSNGTTDVQSVSHWIPDPISQENNAYLEFWEMLLEMPEASGVGLQSLQNLCSVLYDRSKQPDPTRPIRSTELIYRTWGLMQGTAAMAVYRSEFAQMLAAGNPVALGLLSDKSGKSSFIQLADRRDPRDAWDTGEFMMGDETSGKLRPQTVEPFRLHRYCVRNSEYELFDPRHQDHRAFADQPDILEHPVVNVSWYDSWCFARWIGGFELKFGNKTRKYTVTLPSETQWEYGCRCGETTPFTWWDRQHGDQIRSRDCNFDGNYPWPRPEDAESRTGGLYLGRTIRVDGGDKKLQLKPNPWGLSQMHGNVFEWCASWYTEGLTRVLRGGSWFYPGGDCRSGYRGGDQPANRSRDFGFRLAAVLVSRDE